MIKQKTILGAFLVVFTLTGCQASYRSMLDQKLIDKSPAEKRVVLAQECAVILEKHKKYDNDASIQHSERMLNICHKMTGEKATNKPAKKTGKTSEKKTNKK